MPDPRLTRAARLTLGITAVSFLVIGLGFLVVPVAWAASMEITLASALARTDLRATYGGFNVGFGLFLLACARREAWHRPGLLASVLALYGFAAGRLLGWALEGELARFLLVLLLIELGAGSLALWLYGRGASAGT